LNESTIATEELCILKIGINLPIPILSQKSPWKNQPKLNIPSTISCASALAPSLLTAIAP
jgi:hypothetical protein